MRKLFLLVALVAALSVLPAFAKTSDSVRDWNMAASQLPAVPDAALGAFFQAGGHNVSLRWTASADAATNPAIFYNIYRSLVACPASGSPSGLSKIGSTAAGVVTFTDNSVSVGQTYSYIVRATLNGGEAADSNCAGVVIPIAPATGLSGTAN